MLESTNKAVRCLRLPTVNYDDKPVPIISAQQGDYRTREVQIIMYDDVGEITWDEHATATLIGLSPNEVYSDSCTISEDGKTITAKISGNLVSQTGLLQCEIRVRTGDNSGVITSQTFYVVVAKSQFVSTTQLTPNNDGYDWLTDFIRKTHSEIVQIRDENNEIIPYTMIEFYQKKSDKAD